MLIVLEMAPEMNGWAAAIMRMWLSTEQEAPADLAALVGAVEDRVVLGLQVRGAFDRHGAADVVVGGLDLRAGEAEVAQEVEGGVAQLLGRNAEDLRAELVAEGPVVEDEADLEGAGERGLELLDLGLAEAVADERGRVDVRAALERAVADGVGDDVVDLARRVAEVGERPRDRLVDDLEVAAAGELLELHQREVGLDAGGVAVHDQADGAGRRDDRDLGVAEAVLLAELERLVPDRVREVDERASRGSSRGRVPTGGTVSPS